uniref:GCK domain-containing protein n=1 Tax=Oryza glumipatula TaxID=40148 RepID=A0A0E0AA91_9ORYZ
MEGLRQPMSKTMSPTPVQGLGVASSTKDVGSAPDHHEAEYQHDQSSSRRHYLRTQDWHVDFWLEIFQRRCRSSSSAAAPLASVSLSQGGHGTGKLRPSLVGCCSSRLLHRRRWDDDDDDSESAKQCARATAALRRCMEANAEHFKADIRARDEGLDEDQRRRGSPPAPDDDEFIASSLKWR